MKKLSISCEYFNVLDTLECGQVFRFKPYKQGFLVFSNDKACYAYNAGDFAFIECEVGDEEYFLNYFDIATDYSKIYSDAISERVDFLTKSANEGKGVRILNQDKRETLISFMISQNNNIPRIKLIIEKLCLKLGDKKTFLGEQYYTFPSLENMASAPLELYKEMGLGYRAEYIKNISEQFAKGFDIEKISLLDTVSARNELIKLYGVGPKVADCVLLFGLKKTDSFPVDTWIEKIYRENFDGKLTNRQKISEYLVGRFKQNSGYFQQYLFYYKRSKEKFEKRQ